MSDDEYYRRRQREEEENRRIQEEEWKKGLQNQEIWKEELQRKHDIENAAMESVRTREENINDANRTEIARKQDKKDGEAEYTRKMLDQLDAYKNALASQRDKDDAYRRETVIQQNKNDAFIEDTNRSIDSQTALRSDTNREIESSSIDWERYAKDHAYRSQVDDHFDIPSGITRGTRESGHTDELKAEYEKYAIHVPEGYEIHHIIPKNDQRAEEARDILESSGINIDSITNAIILPRGANTPNPDAVIRHEFTFPQEYIEKTTKRLREAQERDDVLNELIRIKLDLSNP